MGLYNAAINNPMTLALTPLKALIIKSNFLNSFHIDKVPRSYYDFVLILISFGILFFTKIPQWGAVFLISFCGWMLAYI